MYKNIGKKIKLLAKTTFFVEAIGAAIGGAFFMATAGAQDILFLGFLLFLLGPVLAWVSSWMLYGFGELIDKACDIERNTRVDDTKSETQTKVDGE